MPRKKNKKTKYQGRVKIHELKLECGHTVFRPARYVRGGDGRKRLRPAPDWVYCEECSFLDRAQELLSPAAKARISENQR